MHKNLEAGLALERGICCLSRIKEGDIMRRINVWVLLSAAILFLGTVITAQPAAAQGQKSFPEAFRVIGNI